MKKRFLSFIIGGFLFLGINLNAFTYNIVNGEQYYVRNINAVVSGYPLLTQLNKGQGFILNASGSCSVNINAQESCFRNYYQWGRKTDGHQLATSIVTTNFQSNIINTNSQFSTNMKSILFFWHLYRYWR